ncbi:hypothetical protein HPB48_003116 [Haemaphysalis longicornis]|uniref:SLC41A/MgtE integral membrane domain-containing protein n=1 Tax=Haemaphysalis longicornis TaxID=44386 RepID=A0A9J6FYJ6_HAELO|nr:hypothetical protein HPB48_003116 [Haemaphysalis longicornis]
MSKVAIVLLGVVLPGQTLFVVLAKVLRFGYVSMSATYYTLYMCATLAQVMVLLYLARLVVYLLWRFSVDPDNAAIPFLTGCGDFLGTGFLTLAYVLLSKLGDATADDEHRFQALGRLSHRPSPPSSLPSSFPWSQPNATTTTYRGVTWT